jgi:hypothetical protein
MKIDGFNGIHSYAFGRSGNQIICIGGRKDGLHARQPFNTFPRVSSNTSILLLDLDEKTYRAVDISNFSTPLLDQLVSTNMNFYQFGDTLYLVGGYGFSTSENTHITFPNVTTVIVSELIKYIKEDNYQIESLFKQITNSNLAISGGQLGYLNNEFILVGGHNFRGRYNPNNGPSFTQDYSNQIKYFTINNSKSFPIVTNYSSVTDQVHLHRRDYNLVPQIFPKKKEGYTISSGVFQLSANLPFLYPVDIDENGYHPITTFNQYLSNYHGAKLSLYNDSNNISHSIFLGGLSQYYYNNNELIKDDNVPFVKTISMVNRYEDSTLKEFVFDIKNLDYFGTSAEFVLDKNIPTYKNEVIKLNNIKSDSFVVGYIIGGIKSNTENPFTNNSTATNTSADANIYQLIFKKSEVKTDTTSIDTTITDTTTQIKFVKPINSSLSVKLTPNPANNNVIIEKQNGTSQKGFLCYISNINGIIVRTENSIDNTLLLNTSNLDQGVYNVTIIDNNEFFTTNKLVIKR